jgi:membrane protease YdiL (CAAX protease family)
VLQLVMLIPAACAIVLGVFFFPNNPVYRRRIPWRVGVFFGFFLVLTLIYAACTLVLAGSPGQIVIFSQVGVGLAALGLLLALGLRFIGGREAFARAGLRWGSPRLWLLFGLAFVVFYVLQTVLNYLFGLGQPSQVPAQASRQLGVSPELIIISSVVNGAVLGPFIGLIFGFGEEYGWRGYLQSELIKLGRVKGTLLVGLIWGIWHAPVIAMGYNYPGQPVLGTIMMTAYTIALAFPLAYAVFKSGSVWLAAYLHALNNQVLGVLVVAFYTPNDSILSFGVGIYGILCLAMVDLLILRDPIWRTPVDD